MQRREHARRERARDELATLDRYLEVLADDCLRGGRPEAADDVRLHRRELALEPLVAGVDLPLRRGLVQAPLAAQLPLEVLDGIGDVQVLAVHPRGFERPVEEAPG